MKTRIAILALCLAVLPWATVARADVKPHAICSDGMVLQQQSKAKIWGTADKGEKINVSLDRGESGAGAVTTADDNGRWAVEVATGQAGGPFKLTISGKNIITFKNILVGEVWVCSGQSNMNWTVNGCDNTDQEYARSAPHNANLRMFTVKQSAQAEPQLDTAGAWVEADPKTVGNMSATGYFFGRMLQEKLKVPVGLIHTSVGGTRIEAWMSQAALEAAGVKEPAPKSVGANSASALYNGMVHPILNYRIKGAIWYQGESNAGNAYQYRTLHPGMIEQWRADFKNPEMPFYFVQLAPYNPIPKKPGESNWAELREAQTMTLKLKNTGMAVITDFGDEADIHPAPKRPVGERLALNARANAYGEKIVHSGPIYKSVKFDTYKAILTFDHVGGGLVGRELEGTPSRQVKAAKELQAWRLKGDSVTPILLGFTMAGKDKVFHTAKADVVGDQVVVTSDMVSAPVAIRYGWANHPLINLYNREGLPASPFRTDTFQGVTQPK